MYTGKMDKRAIKLLLKSFKNGATITAACKACGINPSTLWRWCEKWPNLDKRIENIKQRRTSFVIDAIYINAINGKEASQKLWLEKEGILKRESTPIEVKQITQVNIPTATPEEAEKVRTYAQLIRSHNLVSRTLGAEDNEVVLRDGVEGRQGLSCDPSGDSRRDSESYR